VTSVFTKAPPAKPKPKRKKGVWYGAGRALYAWTAKEREKRATLRAEIIQLRRAFVNNETNLLRTQLQNKRLRDENDRLWDEIGRLKNAPESIAGLEPDE
jgi:predicted RNase H-like nuclease (RuvC/YqgF family)